MPVKAVLNKVNKSSKGITRGANRADSKKNSSQHAKNQINGQHSTVTARSWRSVSTKTVRMRCAAKASNSVDVLTC